MDNNAVDLEIIYHWTARKMHPIILAYVAAVYLLLILFFYFVFSSSAAVKALLITSIGTMVALIPGLITRVEYRLTERTLEHRQIKKSEPSTYKKLFEVDKLNHIKPLRRGFKYYLTLEESNPIKRFWKMNVLSGFSGEVHVEKEDLENVLEEFKRCSNLKEQ